MSAPGPEQNQGGEQLNQLKAEVARQTAQQVIEMIAREEVNDRAREARQRIDAEIRQKGSAPNQLEGSEQDKNTLKGMAADVRVAVQRALIAKEGATPKDLAPPTIPNAENANRLLQQMSRNIRPETVTDQNAPYLYDVIATVMRGETSVEALAAKFAEIRPSLATVSSSVYERLQDTLIEYAKGFVAEDVARERFFKTEDEQNRQENQRLERQAVEEQRKSRELLKPDQEKRLGDLLNKARSKFNTVAEGDQFVKSMLNIGDLSDADARTLLEGKGMEPGEVGDIIELSRRLRDTRDYEGGDSRNRKYGHLREFGLLSPDLLRIFSVDGLKQYLVKDEDTGLMKLSDLGKRTLKRQALFTLNRLMSKVDNNPDTDFHSNFSDLREGMAYFDLQTMAEDLQRAVNDDKTLIAALGGEGSENLKELNYFISKGVTQEMARERSLRELFHTMGIYIKTLGPDKIAEFVARYNLSDIDSIVTSDFSGKLISMAMSEYERYLKFDIAKNKGQLRTSLFAGKTHLDLMYKDNDDRTNLRERLKSTLLGLQKYVKDPSAMTPTMREQISGDSLIQKYDIDNIEGFEDWEIDRALKYAQGIQMTQTIRAFEVIASSRPPTHFRGSADNMVDMAGILNPHWKWQLGRGGQRKMPRYREVLVGDMIVRRPEMSLVKRMTSDKWDPSGFHEKYKAWNEDEWHKQWTTVKDNWLYRDANFENMIRLMSLGGLASRNGWRLTGFTQGIDSDGSEFYNYVSSIQTALINSIEPQKGEKFNFSGDWNKRYEQLAKSVGVGSRFFFDINRATDYAKAQLWKQLNLDTSKLSSQEKDKLWDEYTYGKHGNDELFTLPGGQKVTATELIEVKGYAFRGMNFQALLERSPMDFLNNIVNITPELMPKSMGGDKDDFYFTFDRKQLEDELHAKFPTEGAYEENLKKVEAFQNVAYRAWGEENYKHLHFVRGFYKDLYQWGEQNGWTKTPGLTDAQKAEKIFEEMYRRMDLAAEKVKLRNAPKMNPEDIEDENLRELFFGKAGGKEGLVTHFTNLNENFGGDSEIGDRGFFYHMGWSWYNLNGTQFVPDTTDVDWRFILHNMGAESGENMVKRLWGDLNGYNGVMSKLMGLDDLLAKCAHSHSLEELFKLHSEIRGLKGIAGDEPTYEMQYYLAQIAARYFQEHHSARLPFLLGSVYSALDGKELSLSKIYGGRTAMSLTTDGLNAYFQYLQHNDLIAEEGIYGFDRLAKSLGADWSKLVVGEIIPNVSTALILFMLYKFIKDGLEKSDGGGKKK